MRFSRKELEHLGRAWLIISIAFAIAFVGFSFTNAFFIAVLVSAFTVGIGFLFHELAHKYFAQRYGCWAEFRAFDKMLILAVFLSFFGFIFAAPGAVFIRGGLSARKNGIISIAGPVTNLVLSLIFLGLAFVVPKYAVVMLAGMYVNALLGFFNMLPILNLDGSKVITWNKMVYGIVLGISVVMMLFGMKLFSGGFL